MLSIFKINFLEKKILHEKVLHSRLIFARRIAFNFDCPMIFDPFRTGIKFHVSILRVEFVKNNRSYP